MWSAFNDLDIADRHRCTGRGSWCWEGYNGENCYDCGESEGAGCEETEGILNAGESVVHDGGKGVAVRPARQQGQQSSELLVTKRPSVHVLNSDTHGEVEDRWPWI